ncbi:MAG: hypothetical protein AB1481_00365 [Candidatus Omnitrophota bacterium]
MCEVTIEKLRNLLVITFKGKVKKEETGKMCEDLKRLLPQMQKGFRVLTDLSGLEKMEEAARPDIEEAMELCNQYGVSKVVRVIPDSTKDLGFNILSLFHYSKHVIIHKCNSSEEARSHLT